MGTHRRVRFEDLFSYKRRIDQKRRKTLEELAAQAQDLDMGYERVATFTALFRLRVLYPAPLLNGSDRLISGKVV